jgi:hypothetical protein
MIHFKKSWCAAGFVGLVVALAMTPGALAAPFINNFSTFTAGASSNPGNGDNNPYGVAVVPTSVGNLHKGNVLVSNFNASIEMASLQGTGTTIVQYSSDTNSQTTFATIDPAKLPGKCPGGVGLTTALGVLRTGWVIVGSLPTTDGTIGTVGAGCLIVLNAKGKPVETFSGGLVNGPWDMTADDDGFITTLFFTNVLNGDVADADPDTSVNAGTVVRMRLFAPPQGLGIPFALESRIIGSGFAEENDPAALIIGPTGVGLSRDNTLYVADTVNSRIAAIPQASTRFTSALTGNTVSTGGDLIGPLGLAIAPNGDILTVNGGDGNIVKTTTGGSQTSRQITPNDGGSLFGLVTGGKRNLLCRRRFQQPESAPLIATRPLPTEPPLIKVFE